MIKKVIVNMIISLMRIYYEDTTEFWGYYRGYISYG